MRKLRLDLEQLAVDSFDTMGGAGPRAGTVPGFAAIGGDVVVMPADTWRQSCMIDFCADSWQSGCLTCAGTCGQDTCQNTCKASCHTCYLQETCYPNGTCVTLCLATCPSGGDVCCA